MSWAGHALAHDPRAETVGLAALGTALLLWSLYPFYFKLVDFVPLGEITAHRVVWSAVLLAVWAPLVEGRRALLRAGAGPSVLARLAVASLLLMTTWVAYVWVVVSGRVQDASLGYFLSPLTAVAIGVLVLRERLNRRQTMALVLAGAAVGFELWRASTVPAAALVLACTFSFYGALRKRLAVPPLTGLLIECLLALPFALLWLAGEAWQSGLAFDDHGAAGVALVLLSGPVTVAPLWLFHIGARRLAYVTVGILLYVPPSIIFLEAVTVFGEPLPASKLVTFALVWAALAIYTLDAALRVRRQAPSTASRGVKGSPRSSATGR